MNMISNRKEPRQIDIRKYWSVMNLAERFEQVIATVLGIMIAIIILMALWELIRDVLSNLFVQHERVLSHRVFQSLFGSIMTLLIAMEFQHSIIKVIERREHIIQTKIVVLIALLALTRKFIILDLTEVQPMMLMALSAGILSLGVVFWFIDKREIGEKEQSSSGEQADDITKPHP